MNLSATQSRIDRPSQVVPPQSPSPHASAPPYPQRTQNPLHPPRLPTATQPQPMSKSQQANAVTCAAQASLRALTRGLGHAGGRMTLSDVGWGGKAASSTSRGEGPGAANSRRQQRLASHERTPRRAWARRAVPNVHTKKDCSAAADIWHRSGRCVNLQQTPSIRRSLPLRY
jgi:hypothetical protein